MIKTEERAKKISEIIKELQEWKEKEGDIEVFIANQEEACFDGVGKMFIVKAIQQGESYLAIIRSNVVIKP